jgi:hypothetical protein
MVVAMACPRHALTAEPSDRIRTPFMSWFTHTSTHKNTIIKVMGEPGEKKNDAS